MGSRARSAAATCLVVSGLLLGGGNAHADPGQTSDSDGADVAATAPAGSRPDRPARPARPPQSERSRRIDGAASGNPDRVAADRDLEPDRHTPRKPAAGDRPVDPPAAPEPPPCCDDFTWDCPPLSSTQDRDRPVGVPRTVPVPAFGPQRPDVVDVVPGIDVGGAGAEEIPINAPILIAGPAGFGPAAVPPGGLGPATAPPPASPVTPASPRQFGTPAESAGGRSMPASTGDRITLPASAGRAGYGEYLRGAGVSQIAVLALSGLAGILLLTGAGGLLGYRQAKAAQGVRTTGIARFMN